MYYAKQHKVLSYKHNLKVKIVVFAYCVNRLTHIMLITTGLYSADSLSSSMV